MHVQGVRATCRRAGVRSRDPARSGSRWRRVVGSDWCRSRNGPGNVSSSDRSRIGRRAAAARDTSARRRRQAVSHASPSGRSSLRGAASRRNRTHRCRRRTARCALQDHDGAVVSRTVRSAGRRRAAGHVRRAQHLQRTVAQPSCRRRLPRTIRYADRFSGSGRRRVGRRSLLHRPDGRIGPRARVDFRPRPLVENRRACRRRRKARRCRGRSRRHRPCHRTAPALERAPQWSASRPDVAHEQSWAPNADPETCLTSAPRSEAPPSRSCMPSPRQGAGRRPCRAPRRTRFRHQSGWA